jgi:hypothetical protein
MILSSFSHVLSHARLAPALKPIVLAATMTLLSLLMYSTSLVLISAYRLVLTAFTLKQFSIRVRRAQLRA